MTNQPITPGEPPDARTYFAAERTLLAWTRTGLALMGFGFVVARFGLFLRELAAGEHLHPRVHQSFSLWTGTALVFLGVAVAIAAAVRHWLIVRQLQRNQPIHFHPISLAVLVTLLLGLIGLAIAIYLLIELKDTERKDTAPKPQQSRVERALDDLALNRDTNTSLEHP